jgi:hypothetical protein
MPPRRLTDWANGNREVRLAITCDIDGAETHHNVALVDGAGKLVAKRRISDDAESYRRPLERLVEAGDTAQVPIPVAIETARTARLVPARSLVVNFIFIPYHPAWSMIVIALDVAIMFALSMGRPRTA